ncbi:hypothetical protein Memar_2181 [Methanoculleus marisnigri JR1]|uniref:Uncharacterized protein n=1 Tax=Methanoculleus marisnigri (strain ATCC 35101 / DSM 1498 / JR1) TaxID=368407 RepID=A3CXK4_METMJ|nr:hypothetical protein Memar_2181 [Methanoculleus marisnigri JR1]
MLPRDSGGLSEIRVYVAIFEGVGNRRSAGLWPPPLPEGCNGALPRYGSILPDAAGFLQTAYV